MSEPQICQHPTASYDAEKDNYYCDVCKHGMGVRYYAQNFGQDALKRSHAETGVVSIDVQGFQMRSVA